MVYFLSVRKLEAFLIICLFLQIVLPMVSSLKYNNLAVPFFNSAFEIYEDVV